MSQKRKPNEITCVTIAFVVLFLCMLGYFCVYAMTHEEELINNTYNNRQQLLVAQNTRGSLISADGEILAETVLDEDGKEQRVYPYKNLFAHAVGYTGKGKTGLEAQMNYYLIQSGIPTVDKVQNERIGQKNPGDNVYTTLHVKLQEAASKALGVYKGAVIAMDPKSGEILAMVSKPDFDPNEIAHIWDELITDEESGVLLNRPTQGLYPPGSTFKIVTTLAYMREYPEDYKSYRFSCNGKFSDGENLIHCYHGNSHGNVDLKKSFAKSCNSSYANMGVSIAEKTFSDTLESLMFNQDMEIDFLYNRSDIVLGENVTADTMIQTAIGQGTTQITPLQLTMITSAIANGGTAMKPMLVRRVETAEGAVVKEYAPEKLKKMMSEEEASVLSEYMAEVVKSGTGTKLSGLNYTAAGKTGSAEFSSIKEESHAWFTGFAPVEDPQIAVTVIIEGAGSGGDYAVPMARRVFDAYLN